MKTAAERITSLPDRVRVVLVECHGDCGGTGVVPLFEDKWDGHPCPECSGAHFAEGAHQKIVRSALETLAHEFHDYCYLFHGGDPAAEPFIDWWRTKLAARAAAPPEVR